ARAQSILVSGPILTEKANQFAAQLGVKSFECMNGWLEHFKARCGISSHLICGEANSAPQLLINKYMANKKAWMVSTIFEEYIRFGLQKRKVVLIVDNCPAHPCITGLQFLPLNTTAHTQPLDSGVIRNFKLRYRHDLAMHTLIAADTGNIFKLDVLMSITIMKKVWDLVEKETIANCFHHCGFTHEQPAGEDSVLEEESEESSHFNNTIDQLCIVSLWPTDISQDDYMDMDAVVSVSEFTSDSDVVAALSTIDKPDHDDEDDKNDNDTNIPHLLNKIAAVIAAVDMLQLLLAKQGIDD
uniref:HTH CENPB-type domain-containing protein n=1 Tax=Latimeria chalumnae TaxID=7897 RepID=H2ZY47_LATCH